MLLALTIEGPPVPQGRARVGAGWHVMDPKSREWRERAEQLAALLWRRRPALDVPVEVAITVVAARTTERPERVGPVAWSSGQRVPACCRGDADNFAKAVLDSLVRARVLRNDHLVTDLHVRKVYAAIGEGPKVEVTVGERAVVAVVSAA